MTPQERAVLKSRLEAAQVAYHDLMTGKSVRVLVDQNGERVEFSPANSFRLAAYIEELKRKLGATGQVSGPMRMIF